MEYTDSKDFKYYGTAVSIGKFDMVHIGHRYLMDTLVKQAHSLGLKAVALALDFDGSFLQKSFASRRIDSWDISARRFEATGVDVLIRYHFTKEDASMTPEEFVRDVLCGKLGCRLCVVGDDFRFGRDRSGDTDTLYQLGKRYGYDTMVVKRLEIEGAAVSSSHIRKLYEEGRTEEATKFL